MATLNPTRVNGKATAGDFVTYFDIANQDGAIYRVSGLYTNEWGTDYALTNARTGVPKTSDLRQHGWTFTTEPADAIETTPIIFEDGNFFEVPTHLANKCLGLHNGHLIVEDYGLVYGLTACCNASATGTDDGTACRSCYELVDPALGGDMQPSYPFIVKRDQ